jgi:molybdopterin converting factor subunit 1
MQVKLRLFAAYREAVGRSEMTLKVQEGTSPLHLWRRLAEDYPALQTFGDSPLVAVNQDYASLDSPLTDGDEVAFIPPVAGG